MPGKKTTEQIDQLINGRPLKRIGEYLGFDTLTQWQCVQCSHLWRASPNNVIAKHSGCPVCANVKKGKTKSKRYKQDVLSILNSKHLVLKSEYTRIVDKHNIECLQCGFAWNKRLNDIVNNDGGCPSCAGLLRLTNEVVDQRLKDRKITRIGDVINASTKIKWRCNNNHEWMSTCDSVLNLGSNCPLCNRKGRYNQHYFEKNPAEKQKPAMLYLANLVVGNRRLLKIGITKYTAEYRLKSYVKQYRLVVVQTYSTNLYEAYTKEQEILQRFGKFAAFIPEKISGHTECLEWSQDIIDYFGQCCQ